MSKESADWIPSPLPRGQVLTGMTKEKGITEKYRGVMQKYRTQKLGLMQKLLTEEWRVRG